MNASLLLKWADFKSTGETSTVVTGPKYSMKKKIQMQSPL